MTTDSSATWFRDRIASEQASRIGQHWDPEITAHSLTRTSYTQPRRTLLRHLLHAIVDATHAHDHDATNLYYAGLYILTADSGNHALAQAVLDHWRHITSPH